MMEKVEINKQARLSEHLTSSSVATLGNLSELNCTRLSPHFTLGEMCKTSAKTADGRSAQGDDEWNRRYGEGDDPIVINSGYRSEAVNKAVGGVKGSNHLTGCAADIRVAGMEQALRYAVILLDISDESQEDFDELLLERSPKGSYWLHFAVRPPSQENRRKIRFIQT